MRKTAGKICACEKNIWLPHACRFSSANAPVIIPAMRAFHLVDFAAYYQRGFRNHIVSITEVAELAKSFDYYGCYATYFFFSDEILSYLSAQAESESPSVAGYEGKVWAPFLPLDLDHVELEPALEATRRLTAYLLESWVADPNTLQIYFSGAKGFHVLLDTRLFGKLAPSKNLPMIFDSVRRHLAQQLPESLRSTIDLSIKDRVRLLRLPNTIHEKSKLYKIILEAAEIDQLKPSEICEMARHPRTLTSTDETGLLSRTESVDASDAAVKLFQRVRRQVSQLTRRPFRYRFHRPADLSRLDFRCAGVQKIWESHIERGLRNNCAIRLASEFRLMGLDRDEAEARLAEWNRCNEIDLPAEELAAVAHSAYQHRYPYRYSCYDSILRRFCPLSDVESCRRHAARAD